MTRRVIAALVCAALVAGCGLHDPYRGAPAPDSTIVHAAPRAAAQTRERPPLAAARSFMRGYLPYLYGLGRARAIVNVTPRLRAQLAAQLMTRDDGASPSHPRVEALRLLSSQSADARVRSIVSDESDVYYATDLALIRSRGLWRVYAIRMAGS